MSDRDFSEWEINEIREAANDGAPFTGTPNSLLARMRREAARRGLRNYTPGFRPMEVDHYLKQTGADYSPEQKTRTSPVASKGAVNSKALNRVIDRNAKPALGEGPGMYRATLAENRKRFFDRSPDPGPFTNEDPQHPIGSTSLERMTGNDVGGPMGQYQIGWLLDRLAELGGGLLPGSEPNMDQVSRSLIAPGMMRSPSPPVQQTPHPQQKPSPQRETHPTLPGSAVKTLVNPTKDHLLRRRQQRVMGESR